MRAAVPQAAWRASAHSPVLYPAAVSTFLACDSAGEPAGGLPPRRTRPASRIACIGDASTRPQRQFPRGRDGVWVMQKVPNEVGEVFRRVAEVIWHVVEFFWSWSFGQIVGMFRLPLNTLPLWKQLLFAAVLASLGYLFHKISKDLLKAVQSVVGALVGFATALIGMMPQIVWAGLIAFGGAWVMTNMDPSWIPAALR